MGKKAPLTVERKDGKGGVASERTPHPSSCPPLAADRPRPFRCSSFSHTNRFAGFAWEPCPFANPLKTTKKGAAAPFLGFSPGLGLCGICFQIVQTRDGCVFDRPAWQSKYSAIVSNVPCVEVRLCAIRDAALAGRTAFRLPYVKYSTGANEATRTVYRALGKPNQTAARRAFLEGRAIGEWHAESKCLFCATALFGVQRSFLPYLFCQDRKDMARGAAVTALRIEPRPRRIRNGPAEQNLCLRRKAHLCC